MEGTLTGIYSKIVELWDRKVELDENINVLHAEISQQNLSDALAYDILKGKAQVRISTNRTGKTLAYSSLNCENNF